MFLEKVRELSTTGRRRTWRYLLMTIWLHKHINRSYLITLRGSRNNYWMMIASLIMQQDIPIMGSSMLLPDLQSVLIISHNFSGNWNKIVFNFWCHNVSKISSMKILSNNIEKFWGIKLSSVMVPPLYPVTLVDHHQGCIKAGFFIKSPAGRLKLVKTGSYWSKLAEIFSKQISQNVTDKFNYCNQEHNHTRPQLKG